jgi:hypothetical protein
LIFGASRSLKFHIPFLVSREAIHCFFAACFGSKNPVSFNFKSNVTLEWSLIGRYGDNAWHENEDGASGGLIDSLDPGPGHSWPARSKAVLKGFRFNYW